MREKLIVILSIFVTLVSALYVTMLAIKVKELKDKVEFYEQVICDFGIDEFVNYPEIYYEREE